jgi:hypothetical protein
LKLVKINCHLFTEIHIFFKLIGEKDILEVRIFISGGQRKKGRESWFENVPGRFYIT